MYEELKKQEEQLIREGKLIVSDLTIGSFAIEVNTYAMGRQLYFNPGFFEDKPLYDNSVQTMNKPSSRFSMIEKKMSDKRPDEKIERIDIKLNLSKMSGFYSTNLIGSGYIGKVFKVKEKSDSEFIALKIIKPLIFDEEYTRLINREIDILKKVDHVNIIKYLNTWTESDNSLYIKMELCSITLRDIINENKILFKKSKNEILNDVEYFIGTEILKEVFEGVDYLHTFDPPIIHRNLKSENIMIKVSEGKYCTKICDFGLATSQVIESMSHTQGVGTSNHIAPEVLNGKDYNTKADIFSLYKLIFDMFGSIS